MTLSLPGVLPDLVAQLLEAVDLGPADVVDEAVDASEAFERGCDDSLGLTGAREVGRDVEVADPLARRPAVTTRRPFLLQLAGDLGADPRGRAGDDAHLALESELHGWLP